MYLKNIENNRYYAGMDYKGHIKTCTNINSAYLFENTKHLLNEIKYIRRDSRTKKWTISIEFKN